MIRSSPGDSFSRFSSAPNTSRVTCWHRWPNKCSPTIPHLKRSSRPSCETIQNSPRTRRREKDGSTSGALITTTVICFIRSALNANGRAKIAWPVGKLLLCPQFTKLSRPESGTRCASLYRYEWHSNNGRRPVQHDQRRPGSPPGRRDRGGSDVRVLCVRRLSFSAVGSWNRDTNGLLRQAAFQGL